jgi:hypothetical protein
MSRKITFKEIGPVYNGALQRTDPIRGFSGRYSKTPLYAHQPLFPN